MYAFTSVRDFMCTFHDQPFCFFYRLHLIYSSTQGTILILLYLRDHYENLAVCMSCAIPAIFFTYNKLYQFFVNIICF